MADLSEICNKVCLEPLYTGKCKEECVKRYRKVFAVTDPASLRPKGKWIEFKGRIICSHCGNYPLYDWFGKFKLSDACPNCGADMRGESHDS